MASDFEALLYHEAHLLDSGLFLDWLDLLAPNLRYWAPARAEVTREQERNDEAMRLSLFDETKATLTLRIQRLSTGLAWSENPPTRTRRFISNVTVGRQADDVVLIQSNFMLFRSRSFANESILVGCREDKWFNAERWLLQERKIVVDQCTVENMSVLL